jgi:hypothetical protein
MVFSPQWLEAPRASRFFSISTIALYPFFYFLYKSMKNWKKGYLFWTGVFYGVMLNFHLSGLILLPAILFLLFFKKSRKLTKKTVYFFIGLLVSNIPIIIHDAKNGFQMTIKLLLWIPYRLAGFIGLYQKNTADEVVLKSNIYSFYHFISRMFSQPSTIFGLVVFLMFMFGFLYLLKNKKMKEMISIKILFLFLILGYVSIFFHGNPPTHYYMPLYPVLLILVGLFLNILFKQNRKLFYLLLSIILFSSAHSLWVNNWYQRESEIESGDHITYKNFKKVSEYIVDDSNSEKISIIRVGRNDDFEGNFAQGYQYHMWLYGNEPVQVGNNIVKPDKKPEVQYIIFEGLSFFPDDISDLKIIDNIAVEKNFL